jgi:hypothetical protein
MNRKVVKLAKNAWEGPKKYIESSRPTKMLYISQVSRSYFKWWQT